MLVGGLQKFSLSDFPGMISAIVFTRGCNFRCPYCHNPELVDPTRYTAPFPVEDIMRFLASRRDQLQGVVVTGGEPTLQSDLPDFIAAIRDMGYHIKLDTNGSHPEMLARVCRRGLVDYIAMDIKAGPDSYSRVARVDVDLRQIQRSIKLIIGSGISHEFRTTYLEPLLSLKDMMAIGQLVHGCMRFWLQKGTTSTVLDTAIAGPASARHESIETARSLLEAAGIRARIR